MRTHELAEHAGVNAQTLRYYERRGLLTEPVRSPASYRDYPAEAVAVVRFIKRAQGLGFSLEQIRELLHLAEGGVDSGEATRALAESHIADLDTKIADLDRLRNALRDVTAAPSRRHHDRSLLHAISGDPHDPGAPR
ncbi:MerR family DNA-binding protein [Actinophytocola sp. NPDC049390]|uniref:MerR family DNA-binding protein n=1 Tax=Actinophytocola sp. NPDC049390 TaxID=3363894 RepID=UPI0037A67D27